MVTYEPFAKLAQISTTNPIPNAQDTAIIKKACGFNAFIKKLPAKQ